MPIDISVVLPIYNEEKTLPVLLPKLVETMKSLKVSYELIFVSDGSSDGGVPYLKSERKNNPNIRVIELSRNFGHQAALSAGLDHATGVNVVMMDADLQDEPSVIPSFYEKIKEGYQVAYARRFERKESFMKRWMFRLYYRILRRIASVELPLDSGIFCMMNRSVVDAMIRIQETHRYLSGLRAWSGFRQIGVDIVRPDRPDFAGPSKQSLTKLFDLSLDGIFSFSYVPLHLATWFGGFSLIGAMILVAALVCYRLFTNLAPPGWASILIIILIVGSFQFLILGIIGSYIGRIYDEVKRRPIYIVSSKTGFEG